MLLILFGFWLLLNGQWTTEIAVTGALICTLLYLFMCRFMDYSPRKELQFAKRLLRGVRYVLWLVGEIVRSAFATIRLIWTPTMEVQPKLVGFASELQTNTGRVMLADSITMTPGTITVAIQGKRLLVHCLDESFAQLEHSEMEQRLVKL